MVFAVMKAVSTKCKARDFATGMEQDAGLVHLLGVTILLENIASVPNTGQIITRINQLPDRDINGDAM